MSRGNNLGQKCNLELFASLGISPHEMKGSFGTYAINIWGDINGTEHIHNIHAIQDGFQR